VVALEILNGSEPVAPPHEIAPEHSSFGGSTSGVIVNPPVIVAGEPDPGVTVMFRGPFTAAAMICTDKPVSCVPIAFETGVPTIVAPVPEIVTWLALVTLFRFVPLMTIGTVFPAPPELGLMLERLVVAPNTDTLIVSIDVSPFESVTRNRTGYVPLEMYENVGRGPLVSNDVPSPSRSQSYDVMVAPGSSASDSMLPMK
jgi:hypothetical protein